MTTRSGTHHTRRESLSERQQQVMRLMERGFTNRQIADELGISLDGAKFHVSEILGWLDASNRDEAVAIWRSRTRIRRRPWVWVAAAIGAGAGALGGALAIAAILTGGPATPSPDDATPVVPTSTAAAPPSPTAAPTPNLRGHSGPEVTLGPPIELPEGVVVYYFGGQVPMEGAAQTLRRAYRLSDGLHVEEVYRNLPPYRAIYSVAIDVPTGRIAAAECDWGGCSYGGLPPGESHRVFLSDDGGMTWREGPLLAPQSSFAGFDGARLVVFTPEDNAHMRLWNYFSGDAIASQVSGSATVFEGLGLAITATDGTRVAANGVPLWEAPLLDTYPAPQPNYRVPGLADFHEAAADGAQSRAWTISYAHDGTVTAVWWNDGEFSFTPLVTLSDHVYAADLFGAGHYVGTAALVDLANNILQPIDELVGPGDTGAYLIAAAAGPIARVNTPGDCLNFRDSPSASAPVLRCLPDGALLWLTGDAVSADGASWLPVRGPAGAAGYIDASFVTR